MKHAIHNRILPLVPTPLFIAIVILMGSGCATMAIDARSPAPGFREVASRLHGELASCTVATEYCTELAACRARFPSGGGNAHIRYDQVAGYDAITVDVDKHGSVSMVKRFTRHSSDRILGVTSFCPDMVDRRDRETPHWNRAIATDGRMAGR